MAELLRLSGSVFTATATCTPATLDAKLQELLNGFEKEHPDAHIDSAQHQLAALEGNQVVVSLLVNFSYSTNMDQELHPRLQHLASKDAAHWRHTRATAEAA